MSRLSDAGSDWKFVYAKCATNFFVYDFRVKTLHKEILSEGGPYGLAAAGATP